MVKMTPAWTVALLAVIALMGFAHAKSESRNRIFLHFSYSELYTNEKIIFIRLLQVFKTMIFFLDYKTI